MAITLVEASKLSNDVLRAGVIETVIKESPFLAMASMEEIVGNSLKYNRENVLPSVAFYDIGDTWAESTPTFTQVSASLRILGGDADVDNFLQATRANPQDLTTVVLTQKAKALAHALETNIWYGDEGSVSEAFDGLQLSCAAGQRLNAGATTTPGVLTEPDLRELIDLVKPGKPDALFMSKRTRRILSTYMAKNGSPVNFHINEFGARAIYFDEIPIYTSDFITDTETISSGDYAASTGGAASSIYAIKFDPDIYSLLHNGPMPIIEEVGQLETKDAKRWRVKAYIGHALYNTFGLAILDGISSGAMTDGS